MFTVLIRGAHSQTRTQRHVNYALSQHTVEVAIIDPHRTFKFVARLVSDDVDRATRRVASEQRTLRATEDLNPLNIEKIGCTTC